MLVACNSADNGTSRRSGEDNMNPYFTGKVIEVYDDGCLLEVTDVGNGNFWVGNKVSHKGVELTSLATINFNAFRRRGPCKVVLYCGSLHQNP